MYNSNCLKSLLLSIYATNERLSKEDNTIYCMMFSFLVKMKNYFTQVKLKRIDNIKSS